MFNEKYLEDIRIGTSSMSYYFNKCGELIDPDFTPISEDIVFPDCNFVELNYEGCTRGYTSRIGTGFTIRELAEAMMILIQKNCTGYKTDEYSDARGGLRSLLVTYDDGIYKLEPWINH
jgi:hypothetical protein